MCVTFQIMSNHLNLPQINSSQSIETSQRRSSETGMLLCKISSVKAKGMKTCAMSLNFFSVYILIDLQSYDESVFCFVIMVSGV